VTQHFRVVNANGASGTAKAESNNPPPRGPLADGYGTRNTRHSRPDGSVPAGCTASVALIHIDTSEKTNHKEGDVACVINGTPTTTLRTFSNLNHRPVHRQGSRCVSGVAGQIVTIKFTGTEDSSLQSVRHRTTRSSP